MEDDVFVKVYNAVYPYDKVHADLLEDRGSMQTLYEDVDFDALISQVESKGAMYVGMYISADSKALLAFKGYPRVQGVTVVDVVIW